MLRQLLVVPATLLLMAAPSSAAGDGATDSTSVAHFSWRGRPLPMSSSFLISEFGVHYLVSARPQVEPERDFIVTLDLGYMRNLNQRSAAGGLLHIGVNEDRAAFGPAVRYRRWLSEATAVDLTVGVDVIGLLEDQGHYEVDGPAPWVEAGVSAADLLALTVRGQRWTGPDRDPFTSGSQSVTTWHVGAKLGSYLGPLATLGTAVLIIALFYSIDP